MRRVAPEARPLVGEKEGMEMCKRDKAKTREKRKKKQLGKEAERAVRVFPTVHPSFLSLGFLSLGPALEWERLG
jgi:uracil-DNA glycosylase